MSAPGKTYSSVGLTGILVFHYIPNSPGPLLPICYFTGRMSNDRDIPMDYRFSDVSGMNTVFVVTHT